MLKISNKDGVSHKKANVQMVTSKILENLFKNKENMNMVGIKKILKTLDVVLTTMTLSIYNVSLNLMQDIVKNAKKKLMNPNVKNLIGLLMVSQTENIW